jgi:hypothetical protein
MADPYRITDDWKDGYAAGYESGVLAATNAAEREMSYPGYGDRALKRKTKRKKPQKGKAKLLTDMTAPKWNKYKKGNGKKTYVQIRAQVSRSQDYKRACKRKGFK